MTGPYVPSCVACWATGTPCGDPRHDTPVILDLFAGPGGWDTGLARIGRTDVVGIEWDTAACRTARAAGHARVQADIATLDPHTFGRIAGLIASPPCQGFSTAGTGDGRRDVPAILDAVHMIGLGFDADHVIDRLTETARDPRSGLVLEPIRWALALRPSWLAWEQVPAVLPLWDACGDVLLAHGYSVWTGVLNAEQYGVPQTRRRAVLMASLDGPVTPPTPTHSRYYPRTPGRLDPGVLPWVSMAAALGWTGRDDLDNLGIRSQYGTGGDPHDRRTRSVLEPAWTVTSKIARNRWTYRNGNQARACRRPVTMPAPTVHFGHALNTVEWLDAEGTPTDRVSLDEAALFQTFPVGYPWAGSRTERFRQVGDAVPPLLAAHVLAALGVGALPARTEAAA